MHHASNVMAPQPPPRHFESSDAYGYMYRDAKNKRVAFRDEIRYANASDQGVLDGPLRVRLVADFQAGQVALVGDGFCVQSPAGFLNSSWWWQDCYGGQDAPIFDHMQLGSWTADVARQERSKPGHVTFVAIDMINPESCSLLGRHLTVLNGNMASVQELHQQLWNIKEGVADPSGVFGVPSDCTVVHSAAQVPVQHPMLSFFFSQA